MLESQKPGSVATRVSKNVPFLNLTELYRRHHLEFLSAIEKVISKAQYIGGSELEAFEKNFAHWVMPGSFSVGCGNGTDAITLAALALGLPEGSEAIVPSMTFMATAEGLINAGFKIKLIDIQEGNWLIDIDKLEKNITPQTKLIVPVHLYGQMAAMDRIREIADRHDCKVLEDSAQSHGAQWKGKPVGYWGDIATYSFFPGKNLGAFGDAGGILSQSETLIKKASAIGKHGGLQKYVHERVGYNSRLDNVQAAILNVKLRYISEWNEARRRVAKWYRELLSGMPGLTLSREEKDAKHVYHLFPVLVEDRASFMNHMKSCGVETGVHYPRALHQLPAFEKYDFGDNKFPVSEKLAFQGVSIPMCPTLSEADVEYVAQSIRSFFLSN